MTTGIAATAVAPGAADVGHAPGWKHPLPAIVTVVEAVRPVAIRLNSNKAMLLYADGGDGQK